MDSVKVFEFDAEQAAAADGEEVIIGKFKIRDQTFEIRPLNDTSVIWLVHRTQTGTNTQILSAVLNFTEQALTPDSAKRFERLALDAVNGLKLAQVVEVFQYILGVVSAFPTGPSNDSSPQPQPTGSASRARSRAKA